MLHGLDLFSGIGGLSLAIKQWVRPIAYCEIDAYCRGILLSRFADGGLPYAPIWDDVRTLTGSGLPKIDIIYGGFPCQDISFAGQGAGLDGERSGLFFEILRLIDEIKPPFIFLENVAAIRTRGGERVVKELAARGYDCRWDTLSAFDMGAPHKRERWWLLGFNANYGEQRALRGIQEGAVADTGGTRSPATLCDTHGKGESVVSVDDKASRLRSDDVADSNGTRLEGQREISSGIGAEFKDASVFGGWEVEPAICRVVDGLPNRLHRLRALGNAVVPAQAQEAFKRLMGIY